MADIRFNCTACGQTLEAPAEMSGDLVACPSCSAEFRVPTGESAPAVGGHASCPECGAQMEEDAVLCVQCGYHLTLGKKISTDLS